MTKECGIIFVHGIVGNNHVFDFLRELVPAECEIVELTLSGHGGNALDFSRASMAQWKTQVAQAVDELSNRCKRIVGVGHSMGCLLLLSEAAKGSLSELFLLNAPLRIRIRPAALKNAIKVAIGSIGADPVAQAAKESYGISFDMNPLHYYGWPRRYYELFRESKSVRKETLPKVDCRVTAILSRQDEMVSLSSLTDLKQLQNVTTIVLPSSTHYYYCPTDRLTISDKFKKIF